MIYHKAILADLLTPVSAFMRVSRGAERAFLLESVEGGEKMGRYSFIGIDPILRCWMLVGDSSLKQSRPDNR